METNRTLKTLPPQARQAAIHSALVWAKLEDLLSVHWFVEEADECDTVTMLENVCLTQRLERTVPFAKAIEGLVDGYAPRGATPLPDAAAALRARRGWFGSLTRQRRKEG